MTNKRTIGRRPKGYRVRPAAPLPVALFMALATLALSCGGEKKGAPPVREAQTIDLTGDWRSDIESGDRTISRSIYRIEQSKDSLSVRLVSTKSPGGVELVPAGMIFEASGEWKNDTARLGALYWVSGKDSCTFSLMGKMDPGGRLLLFFPGDICGERSLPFTRKLQRADST